jgi:hypothetical protein
MSTGARDAWCVCCHRHTAKLIISGLGRSFTQRTGEFERQAPDLQYLPSLGLGNLYIQVFSDVSQHISRYSRSHVFLHYFFFTYCNTHSGCRYGRTPFEGGFTYHIAFGEHQGKDGCKWLMEALRTVRRAEGMLRLEGRKLRLARRRWGWITSHIRRLSNTNTFS